ncbi:MAG: (d)CMP kinase [Flavobacteriaceae bacterium]|jgi:cytidylate kinase|nr:(d)CMP kinase [Flavobacteriaceae bacterium]
MKKNSTSPIIAIDGYSSTGKSSYAKMVAKELGWKHIDTGAMYRAVTLYGIQNFSEGNIIDTQALVSHLKDIHIDFKFNPETQDNDTFLNGKNVESSIRDFSVSEQVSLIAKIPEVRDFLVKQQREIGEKGNIVMDGRDIGTVVFPYADLKLFITAGVDERAKRRFLDFREQDKSITLEEVKENLKQRDYIDQNREISPLVQAQDAILIDNSHLNKEETYREILRIIKERLGG